MFCPLEVTWGNGADWAAAIGSIVAVIAAVWIANGQKRFARWQKDEADRTERIKHRKLLHEIIRVAEQLEDEFTNVSNLHETYDPFADGEGQWLDCDRIRSQLLSLQSLAVNDPRLFGEIGSIYHVSEPDMSASQSGHIELVADLMRQEVEKRIAVLKDLLDEVRV